ncbi:MAG TPA: WD40 repeat domain-containing protein [Caulobacteraceae bacterium]
MRLALNAYVSEVLFEASGAVFALGDGVVRWADGAAEEAHDGAVLCAAPHPSGEGVITGGDDGRLVWSRPGVVQCLAHLRGRWVDAVATAPSQGLIAFASGRELRVLAAGDAGFERRFIHEKSVAALAFDAKGRRLAAATYGGVALWYAKIADQKPVMLRAAGSHIGALFSPDARFVVSSLQEGALHGWRISDAGEMRMGGYPAKVHSLAFVDDGAWLATSGARAMVLWPFGGASGPMGRHAVELGPDPSASVARVAGSADGAIVAAGLDDGRIWTGDVNTQKIEQLAAATGRPITAMVLAGSRLAWGDDAGGAGVIDLPPF